MSRFFVVEDAIVRLTGDTFRVKDALKTLGGRWDSTSRSWIVQHSETTLSHLEQLGFVSNQERTGPKLSAVEIEANPEAQEQRVWKISDVLNLTALAVRRHFPSSFWVVGEITSLRNSSGHVFFELADGEDSENYLATKPERTASLSTVLWAGRKKILEERAGKLEFQEGLKLKCLVHVEIRREGGRMSLVIDDINLEFTSGNLALARQNVIRELRKRGLYDLNGQRTLGHFPLRVALITAPESRALSDFFDELRRSGLAFRVDHFVSLMQGPETSSQICNALQRIGQVYTNYDCIVITRGGGSRLDLRWFDDLEIGKAIAHCPLPIITAIGHFEDVSVADEVSYKAEKTPTGAARFLVECVLSSFQSLQSAVAAMAQKSRRRMEREKHFLLRLEELAKAKVLARLERERAKLNSAEQTLRAMNSAMRAPLKRGFASVKNLSGKFIDIDADSLECGSQVKIEMHSRTLPRSLILTAEIIKTEVVHD